jgi:hypothetical protein
MKKYNGVIDLGTPEQKKGLYRFEELVSTPASFSLAITTPDLWKIYPLRNQAQSNTCVYQARAKMAGILQEQKYGEFIEYSASDYNKRSFQGAGAFPVEALDFMRKHGIGLEVLEPSQNMSDAEIAKVKQTEFKKQVALVSLLDAYMVLPAYNFDILISTLQATKKPIMVGFYATMSEWNQEVVDIKSPELTLSEAYVRHEVCATPNYGIYKGKEGFTIEDSWGGLGINKKGVRWITREFFEKRNYIAGLVPTSFKSYEEMKITPEVPKYNFTKNLQYGESNQDIVALQNMLKYEGYFPANQSSTGNYFELTARCVLEWQKAHAVDKIEVLEELKGRYFGNKSREVANKLYK